jgi:hypothetical protein
MRPKTTLITFLSLINKGFQRPELIELIEQERRYALFGKNLGWFWCLLICFAPDRGCASGADRGNGREFADIGWSRFLSVVTDPETAKPEIQNPRFPAAQKHRADTKMQFWFTLRISCKRNTPSEGSDGGKK